MLTERDTSVNAPWKKATALSIAPWKKATALSIVYVDSTKELYDADAHSWVLL